VADEELAVEVIGFVQKRAGEQALAGFFEELALDVLGTHGG